ncbi:HET domain-containing protein [Xylaria digitata]|nr:HET domain-containing protein [Xylaria digitata]
MMRDYQCYKYCPLVGNSIRLLGLSATDGYSNTLKTVNVNEAPPYFALSYSWGQQIQDVPMIVDGQVVLVSPSVADAIEQLRGLTVDDSVSTARVEWIWIDKICINQCDLSEQSKQVQLMNSIYSKAIRTLIWLGPDYDSCSAAWRLIDRIYSVFRRENPDAEFMTDIPLRMYSSQKHAVLGLPRWDDKLWQHLRRLFESLWFTRVWVIQEVALSQKDPIILHGQRTYPWHRLGWVSAWMYRNGYQRLAQVPNRMQNVNTISSIRQSRTLWRLDALLYNSKGFCATDQRDKVYGLLGLAIESQNATQMPTAIQPNYTLEVAEVYIKAALFLLREYKLLSFLTCPNGILDNAPQIQHQHQPKSLPSWAPNWCDSTVIERDSAKSLSWISDPGIENPVVLGFPGNYNASSGLSVKLFDSPNQSMLRLSGLKVDIVVSVTQFDNELESPKKAAHDPPLLQLWKVALPFRPKGRTLANWIASWVEATTAEQHHLSGRTAEQIFKDGAAYLYTILSSNKYQQPYSASGQNIIELLSKLSNGGDAEIYTALASNFCLNRKFIVTLEGRMGIAPMKALLDDLVFVIFGGGVPYILRAHKNGFLFVGQSCINGLMGGEAVQAWQRGELAEEILELQ